MQNHVRVALGGICLGNGGRLCLTADREKARVLTTLGLGPGLGPLGLYHRPWAMRALRAQ